MKNENIDEIDYPYDKKDIILDKASMVRIELPNQRHIRETQVNSIFKALKRGEHFDSNFVVNVNNGRKKIRVLDGGHRTEALKKFFEVFPNKKIKVSMAVYKDLNESQERAIYTKWNLGVKQSVDDFIWSYRQEIPEYENIVSKLPTTVYGSSGKIRLRYIVDAYLSSKKCPYVGGCGYSRLEWLEALKKLTYDDVRSMKETFEILDDIFNPNNVSDFVRMSPFKFSNFKALYRLVHTNKEFLGKNYVVKRMRNILYNKSILDQFRAGQRQQTVEAFNLYKRLLNQGAKHQFK